MHRGKFGPRNLVFACTLVDYGYYLLSIDSVGHAIKTYQVCSTFYGNNFYFIVWGFDKSMTIALL